MQQNGTGRLDVLAQDHRRVSGGTASDATPLNSDARRRRSNAVVPPSIRTIKRVSSPEFDPTAGVLSALHGRTPRAHHSALHRTRLDAVRPSTGSAAIAGGPSTNLNRLHRFTFWKCNLRADSRRSSGPYWTSTATLCFNFCTVDVGDDGDATDVEV